MEYESVRSYNASYAYNERLTSTAMRRHHRRLHISLVRQLLQTVETR